MYEELSGAANVVNQPTEAKHIAAWNAWVSRPSGAATSQKIRLKVVLASDPSGSCTASGDDCTIVGRYHEDLFLARLSWSPQAGFSGHMYKESQTLARATTLAGRHDYTRNYRIALTKQLLE